jgi:hypothetical protein
MPSLDSGVSLLLALGTQRVKLTIAGYYIAIPIFKQYPMKKLSHLLGQLWESDPNKPLWSLMAKAWSTIRDRIGKDNAPLDGFFAIICPYLQMPLPEMYLDLHGWTLSTDKEGGPTLSRDKNSQPASITAGVAHMPISVEDIIAYSQVMGYAQGFVVDANTFSPTFLGASLNLATGKRDLPEVPRAPVDDRMLARNKRRVKKQTARETGLQSLQTLEQDLANTRAFQLQLPEFKDLSDVDLPVSEDHPMYHMLTGFFAGDDQETEMFVDNHEGDLSTGNDQESGLSNDTPFENVETPSLEDWAAFCQGADAEAILPPFGDATNF